MKKLLIFIPLFIAHNIWAQRMSDEYSDTLGAIVHDYMYLRDKPDDKRSAEMLILFLESDSSGKINGIHILADQKNLGSTYNALKDISPQAFENWKVPLFKNKVIILAIYTYSESQAKINYVDLMNQNPFFIDKNCDYKHIKEFIMCRGINYVYPMADRGEKYGLKIITKEDLPPGPPDRESLYNHPKPIIRMVLSELKR